MVRFFLQQLHGHGLCAAELNHRLVNGEAGIGIDDLGAGFRESQQHVEHDGFGAGRHYHLLPVRVDSANLAAVAGHGLAQFGQARRGAVVGVSILQRFHAGLYDVLRRLKVRLADFEVDYFPALGFKGTGFG